MSKTQLVRAILPNLLSSSAYDPAPVEEFEKVLAKYFGTSVFLVNSGRSAIYLLLKAANIGPDDEVLIQAYTCNAVPNPIIWSGATPVYVDIDPDTLNINLADLVKKISRKTKAVILQHTLGRPGPIDEAVKIAKEKGLFLIEDCAHSLGAEYAGQKLGTFGDAAILSFARSKVISSISGGAILVENERIKNKIAKSVDSLTAFPKSQLLKEYFNYFSWRLALRKVYFSGFGENLLNWLDKQDFFNVLYSRKELSGEKPAWHPSKLPSIFAKIGIEEFKNLETYNMQRRKIADIYLKEVKNPEFRLLSDHDGVYLRFAAFYKDPEGFTKSAREHKILIGNWYNYPVYPKGTNLEKVGYQFGSCPAAEKAAATTINLPNYIGMRTEKAREIARFINNY